MRKFLHKARRGAAYRADDELAQAAIELFCGEGNAQ